MTQIEIKKYHINNLNFTVRIAGLENNGDLVSYFMVSLKVHPCGNH